MCACVYVCVCVCSSLINLLVVRGRGSNRAFRLWSDHEGMLPSRLSAECLFSAPPCTSSFQLPAPTAPSDSLQILLIPGRREPSSGLSTQSTCTPPLTSYPVWGNRCGQCTQGHWDLPSTTIVLFWWTLGAAHHNHSLVLGAAHHNHSLLSVDAGSCPSQPQSCTVEHCEVPHITTVFYWWTLRTVHHNQSLLSVDTAGSCPSQPV